MEGKQPYTSLSPQYSMRINPITTFGWAIIANMCVNLQKKSLLSSLTMGKLAPLPTRVPIRPPLVGHQSSQVVDIVVKT